MHLQQAPSPRGRSAFAAAFLSLLFPGLGHAYLGVGARALGFAAFPVLAGALVAGLVLRADRLALVGWLLQPGVLVALFAVNGALLLYRAVAVVDAWRVARFLGPGDRRSPLATASVAGLLAVVLVLGLGHVAVARYQALALDFVGCVFTDETSAECELPGASATPDGSAEPSEAVPTADPSAPVASSGPTPPPWDGKERLNILLIGTDQRPDEASFNTDTLIVVSIDPATRKVAMLQLPRDTVDVPVPPGPARSVWGSVYRGKINSWFTQNRRRSDLWEGTDRTRGYVALKAILGELYGLDIRWFVEVNFQGFREVVDTLGGVRVNVQIPVSDDRFPGEDNLLRRVYIPSGPQQMDGTAALQYARSRHSSSDFDRGRRQQRVLLSLKEQADVATILANLVPLQDTLKRSVKTDIPPEQLPRLLGLADGIDTRDVRSLVFTPPFFATEVLDSPRGYIIIPKVDVIRRAVAEAFTADPARDALRERLGAEAARVWVVNQSTRSGLAARIADYLAFDGVDASAPNQRPEGRLQNTRITVYNGAEVRLPQTIAYLEGLFGVEVVLAADPAVRVDVIVAAGQRTPSLEVEPPG